jgi:hypothetical protein
MPGRPDTAPEPTVPAKNINGRALTKKTGPAAMSLNHTSWQGGRGAIKED